MTDGRSESMSPVITSGTNLQNQEDVCRSIEQGCSTCKKRLPRQMGLAPSLVKGKDSVAASIGAHLDPSCTTREGSATAKCMREQRRGGREICEC
jgi:hypothetical protein